MAIANIRLEYGNNWMIMRCMYMYIFYVSYGTSIGL